MVRLTRHRPFRLALTFLSLLLLVVSFAAPHSAARQEKVPLSVLHPVLVNLIQNRPDFRVPVIVQKVNDKASSQEIARGAGASIDEEFSFIRAFRVTVPARALAGLARAPGVRYISPDGPVSLSTIDTTGLQTVYPHVSGGASLWNAGTGLTGQGVTVAVADSGVAPHPDFGSRVPVRWSSKSSNQTDVNGHGTHVAGTIAGRSADGQYIGVAPDATIVAVKTSNDQYNTSEAGVVKALQWIYENRSTYNIRVVNMSLSAHTPNSYLFSPMAAAAEKLWQAGVVVVVAAGNRGPGPMWYPPANDPFLITVGALDDNGTVSPADDSLALFSSYGITQNRFSKPDLVAPGRKIVAPLSSTTASLAKQFPDRVSADGEYIRLSGTSMATPVVTGLIALMLQRYPDLTPNQVKWALTSTTTSYANQPAGSAGQVNIQAALDLIAQRKAMSMALGEANQGPYVNPQIDLLANNFNWEGTNWSQAIQSKYTQEAYWETAYWETAYWETAYWETAYWETAYWETFYEETVFTDNMVDLSYD